MGLELPDVPEDWKTDNTTTKPEVGEYYLPGVGRTYFHPEFADKVSDFIKRTHDQGISLQFRYGYRSQAEQDALHGDPNAITPADYSLHSAGRGVDIRHWFTMGQDAQNKVLEAAKASGLDWGGTFRKKPDQPHFYSDPGSDRQQLVDRFTQAVAAFKSQIPDR